MIPNDVYTLLNKHFHNKLWEQVNDHTLLLQRNLIIIFVSIPNRYCTQYNFQITNSTNYSTIIQLYNYDLELLLVEAKDVLSQLSNDLLSVME